MTYEFSLIVAERLELLSDEQREPIALSLAAWAEALKIGEPMPAPSTDEATQELSEALVKFASETTFMSPDCWIVSTPDLHRSTSLKKLTKEEFQAALDRLAAVGIFTAQLKLCSGGRPKEVRYLAADFTVVDNDQAHQRLEQTIFALLAASTADAPAESETLAPTTSPVTYGPLRVLLDQFVSVGNSYLKLPAGTIVEDEIVCRTLLETGGAVVKLDEVNVIACQPCALTFSRTPDENRKVLICLQDLRFWMNGCTILRKKGDVEADQFIVEHLLSTHAPVTLAKPHEYAVCPRCQLVCEIGEAISAPIPQHLQKNVQVNSSR